MPEEPVEQLPPSGEQYEIGYGHHRVVVTEVGANLRVFNSSGVEIIDGFDETDRATDGRGQVLAPWPNRLAEGSYTFEGCVGNAALDEPQRQNAIHGLVRWLGWTLLGRAQNVVTLATILQAQPGFPWKLALTIEYRLGREGLSVTTEARNMSGRACPFGLGFHPYLTVGTPLVDGARLLVPAKQRLVTDDRGLPTGALEVDGTEFDFSAKRLIGPTALDTGFFDLVRHTDGTVRAELTNPDGNRQVTLWADSGFKYLMVYTADTVASPRRRRSVAVEPMTCPPNALRSGTDVVRLAPGGTWRGTWGISPRIDDA